jgi:hypothetical protein
MCCSNRSTATSNASLNGMQLAVTKSERSSPMKTKTNLKAGIIAILIG